MIRSKSIMSQKNINTDETLKGANLIELTVWRLIVLTVTLNSIYLIMIKTVASPARSLITDRMIW